MASATGKYGSSAYTRPREARAISLVRKFGVDIRNARRRRRIPTMVMAERASISRMTLNKVEKGDSNVSIGIYVKVLFVLGMNDRFAELADTRHDSVGLSLEDEILPKRIRTPGIKKARGVG